MESLGYMLIYFLKGELPWSELHHDSQQLLDHRQQKIAEIKRKTPIKELCRFCPKAFATYMELIR